MAMPDPAYTLNCTVPKLSRPRRAWDAGERVQLVPRNERVKAVEWGGVT